MQWAPDIIQAFKNFASVAMPDFLLQCFPFVPQPWLDFPKCNYHPGPKHLILNAKKKLYSRLSIPRSSSATLVPVIRSRDYILPDEESLNLGIHSKRETSLIENALIDHGWTDKLFLIKLYVSVFKCNLEHSIRVILTFDVIDYKA